ncbi:conjugal transfer protein TraD [Sphingomonas sp. MS122]|uniref:conjugal transfer protein TraD n=1 Tax=Sphingomonas sp. MS122 TaxID=3412683 RepID=UPI003C2D56FB
MQLIRARHDTRVWAVKRRERTRQLIELGGLVAKAGLVELTDDDRAVIFGALVEIAARLRGLDREEQLQLMRRRGKRAFGRSQVE